MTEEQLTEQDIADLEALHSESSGVTHTIIEIWQANLEPADQILAKEFITPGFANKIVSTWPKLSVQDVKAYHTLFHQRVIRLRSIFDEALEKYRAETPDALERVEDDATYNRDFYIEILTLWQEEMQRWEYRDFDVTSPDAHIDIAVIAEVKSFFLGEMGLAQHLQTVGFSYDEEAQARIGARLQANLEEL